MVPDGVVAAGLQVPGIGKVAEQTLSALGITTCSQLLQQRALLKALFKPTSSNFFLQVSGRLGAAGS